jgi:PAS domain S-box-containing protein
MRILIAEDDTDSRMVLQKNLEGAGHVVDAAVNGQDALERAKKCPPDLIISDILMPVLDGYKFCFEVKNDKALNRIPFVFYTATYVDLEDERLAIGLGASRYILKPVEPDEFLRQINEVVRETQEETIAVPDEVVEDPLNLFRMYDSSVARKLHEKVRELELYRLIFANSIEAVAIVDRAGSVLKQNPAQHRLLGYTDEELQGRSPSLYLQEKTSAAIRDDLAKGSISEGEGEAFTKSGQSIFVEYTVFPIRSEDNAISAHVWMLRDISERQELTAQLLQSQKLEAVGKLAGGVAHDFNNMLSIILGYTEIARKRFAPSEPVVEELLQVELAGRKAANLVRQLLLFSRKQPLKFTSIDLPLAIEELAKMLSRVLGENIRLALDIADDCWKIEGDAGNIDQVIMNLAVNARDAMAAGGVLSMKVENIMIDEHYCQHHLEARPGRFVRLSVSDTGTGMSGDLLEHIFEPFYTTKEVGQGTGLGLAVVYGIVKSHKGWVNVYSEPGQGTTFRLHLPAVSAAASGAAATVSDREILLGHGERILVVEDDEMIRQLQLSALGQNGYVVTGAASAEEGLERFTEQAGDFDLVVSDVVLPAMNGVAFVEKLRESKPNLSVLLCSGYADQKNHWPFIQERGYAFLEKPFTLVTLYKAVREALDTPQS